MYIVDGMPAGNDALNHMSPADIESIDILKDAASTTIYGSRGANGIVLVTTKQGKVGKPKLTYDGYYGQQYLVKKPDLLNAREYMMIQDEIRFNENNTPYNWQNLLPAQLYQDVMSGAWKGSDWVDAFYTKGAPKQGHAFNLTGGNEYSKFSIGYSHDSQDGIFGEAAQGHYKRHTFRINSDHVLLKGNGFDAIRIGETLSYSYRLDNGISTGNIYWNAFHNVLVANPLMPIYNENGGYYDYYDKRDDGWGFDGNFSNPIAAVATSSQGLNQYKNHNMRTSVFMEIQPVKGLIFKSQFGYFMSSHSGRTQTQKARLSNNYNVTDEAVDQNQSVGNNWTLENTLTYNLTINNHQANFMVGQAAEKWGYGEDVSAGGQKNIFDLGWDYAWVNNMQPTQLSERRAGGSPWGRGASASYFGRIQYNYRETYMATINFRADGSSNFARGNRWGYFPSFSAGWVITNEPFMSGVTGGMNFLKLRASWGQNGNSSVDGFQYLSK
jgi:TonB-linked SusC/RagA family outer membrane protein